MKYTTQIQIGEKNIEVHVEKIASDFVLDDISRVYVVACNDDEKIGLIYNSKRDIRWFPWWHTEQNESIIETAKREYIEEMRFDLQTSIPSYILRNQIDTHTIEKQVICFWKIGMQSNAFTEDLETVTQVWFFDVEEVLKKIKNTDLRKSILEDFISHEFFSKDT